MPHSHIIKQVMSFLLLRNFFIPFTILGNILIIRLLPPSEYGKWFFIWNLIITVGPFLNLGFISSLAKFIPEVSDQNEKNKFFTSSLWIVTLLCALLFIPYMFLFTIDISWIPVEIREVKFSFFIFLYFISIIPVFEGWYRGLGQFNRWTVWDGCRGVSSIALSLAVVYFFSKTFHSLYYSYFCMATLSLGLLILIHRKNFSGFNLQLEKRVTQFTLAAFFAQLAFMLRMNVDPILIRTLVNNSAELAFFDVGTRIPRMIENLLLGSLSIPFIYHFSRLDTQIKKEEIVIFGTRMIACVIGLLSIGLFSFAKLIIPVLFSNNYTRSIPVLECFALVPFLTSFLTLPHSYLIAGNKPFFSTFFMFIAFLLTLILDLILIPHLGAVGAALSATLVVFIFNIAYLLYIARQGIYVGEMFTKFMIGLGLSMIANYFVPYTALGVFALYILKMNLMTSADLQKIGKFINELTGSRFKKESLPFTL